GVRLVDVGAADQVAHGGARDAVSGGGEEPLGGRDDLRALGQVLWHGAIVGAPGVPGETMCSGEWNSRRYAGAMALDPASVLGKAMRVLHAFDADDHGLGFAELQRRTGLPKATLHRIAGDLVEAGLLDRVDGAFHLGSHLFELGMRASVERTLLEVATPFLEDLYERTHEVVHLALREGSEVVYVAKVAGHRAAKTPSRLGGRMPVNATALGKALLAHAGEEERIAVLSGPLVRRTPRTITAPGRLRQQLDQVD